MFANKQTNGGQNSTCCR